MASHGVPGHQHSSHVHGRQTVLSAACEGPQRVQRVDGREQSGASDTLDTLGSDSFEKAFLVGCDVELRECSQNRMDKNELVHVWC